MSKKIIILIIALAVISLFFLTQSKEDKFIYGVGVHSSHYKDFDGMKDLGVDMVREDLCWECAEKVKGVYDWKNGDKLVANATQRNISVLFILDYTNWIWAIPRGNKYAYVDCQEPGWSNFKEGYGKFAYEAAKHYKGKVEYFEIWNEPNYHFCTDSVDGTIEGTLKYGELMKEAYTQIKKANPDAKVVSAGTGTWNTVFPMFFEPLYQYGYNDYLDIVGVHPYTFPANPPINSEYIEFKNLEKLHNLMVSYGDKDKKIWITETGIPSAGCSFSSQNNCNIEWSNPGSTCCPKNLSLENQAKHLKEVYRFIDEKYPYVEAVFWYDYMEDASLNINDVERNFGITYANLTRKPAWYEYKNLIAVAKSSKNNS